MMISFIKKETVQSCLNLCEKATAPVHLCNNRKLVFHIMVEKLFAELLIEVQVQP